jgi:signal recognition particle GTPase
LKNWPGVTPAQLKMCHNASIYSVEDLRDANADCIRKLGMGALALIEKAKAYLGSAQTNKASEEISALKVDMEAMKATIEKKDEQIAALMDKLGGDAPRQTRRSRNKETGELE